MVDAVMQIPHCPLLWRHQILRSFQTLKCRPTLTRSPHIRHVSLMHTNSLPSTICTATIRISTHHLDLSLSPCNIHIPSTSSDLAMNRATDICREHLTPSNRPTHKTAETTTTTTNVAMEWVADLAAVYLHSPDAHPLSQLKSAHHLRTLTHNGKHTINKSWARRKPSLQLRKTKRTTIQAFRPVARKLEGIAEASFMAEKPKVIRLRCRLRMPTMTTIMLQIRGFSATDRTAMQVPRMVWV